MKEYLYYSRHARTSGNFDMNNLMKAGRMDIACQIIISSFFLSHDIRKDVKLHLVFDGPPDPPKHLELFPGENLKANNENKIIHFSKKDVAWVIKKVLYGYEKYKKRKKDNEKVTVVPGYYVEKKPLESVVDQFIEEGKTVFILDRKGEDIRNVKKLDNVVFIIGDQDGIPKDKIRRIKKKGAKLISIGPKTYFASQVLTIIQNELDRREI